MTQRNVILILTDQHRYDTIGVNGSPICRTPSLDRFARSGVNFTQAYSVCGLCTPARASIYTGLLPHHHELTRNVNGDGPTAAAIPKEVPTLAERLNSYGYRCHFIGKWHAGNRLPAQAGFSGFSLPGYGNPMASPDYRAYLESRRLQMPTIEPLGGGWANRLTLAGKMSGPVEASIPCYLAERTIEFMHRQREDGRPFFLALNFWGPHAPYLPSEPYASLYDSKDIPPWPNFEDTLEDKPTIYRRYRDAFIGKGNPPRSWEECALWAALYFGFTTQIDAQIGRVLTSLDAFGLTDETAVLFSTDHGDLTGAHGGLHDKGVSSQEIYHIPMMARLPGAAAGATSDRLVSNMDLSKTVLDVAGVDVPEQLDGRSLVPLLNGEEPGDWPDFAAGEFFGHHFAYETRYVVHAGFKYVFHPSAIDELYDLRNDPWEMTNLIDSDDCVETLHASRRRLIEWAKETDDELCVLCGLFHERLGGGFAPYLAQSTDRFRRSPTRLIPQRPAREPVMNGPSETVGMPTVSRWTPNLFGDHMVVQRDMSVPVWGWAEPGEDVIVRFKGQEKTAQASDDGKWMVTLDAMNADTTPHNMELISASGNKTIRDILVGEVWLCSGQSNMGMIVSGCENAPEEISAADYPHIRHFKVTNTPDANKPPDNVSGSWQVCSPATVGGFSGVGFFFARDLYNKPRIPVGLINASWGGTQAEAWTPRECLESEGDFKPILERYRAALEVYPEKQKQYEEKLKPWLVELERDKSECPDFEDTCTAGKTNGWADADFDDSDWETVPPGSLKAWKGPSVLWFRYHLNVPVDWEGKALLVDGLSCTPKAFGAETRYFNGVRIGGSTETDWHEIRCTIPGNLVKPGPAVLALRVFTNKNSAQLKAIFKVAPKGLEAIVLQPPCRGCYKAAASKDNDPLDVIEYPDESPMGPNDPNSPASLFNSYIHPLIPYRIRGALWYQGESNVGRAYQYRKLLPAMIRDWRAAWGQGNFPFLIVQVANYTAPRPEPEDSDWAELREAQAMTASTAANTGLVVAIDVGDADDVHPQDKQTVGERLSLAARGIAYGEDVVYSGPVFATMKVEGETIRLAFTSTGSGLVAKGGVPLKGFAIAGQDRKFVWARAEIDGDTVLVCSDKVRDPVAVRYAWAGNPEGCSLYNKEGLPAGPFRTDDWPGLTTNEK